MNDKLASFNFNQKDKYESTKIKACLVCIGTIAYIGTALIMR